MTFHARLVLLPLALAVSACATPPGKLKQEDMVWLSQSVQRTPAEVMAGLQNYSRTCGGLLGGNVPEWYPGLAGAPSKVDVYLPTAGGGRGGFIYGLIEIRGTDSSEVRIGVQSVYSKPLFRKAGFWKEDASKMLSEIEAGSPPSCP